jgi:hypothetical protein
MNTAIIEHFDRIEAVLIDSPGVLAYQITRREVGPSDGKLRVRATFIDGSNAEFFQLVIQANDGILAKKYSYHWQNANAMLRQRWDNAPHHLSLANPPHHIHLSDGQVVTANPTVGLIEVLQFITDEVTK